MSLVAYKILHLFGIVATFVALGGLTYQALSGGGRAWAGRALGSATHGIGVVIILVSGFGMLARLGLTGGLPGWIWLKLLLWLVVGALVLVLRRAPGWARTLWFLLPFLAALGAYLALYKPF